MTMTDYRSETARGDDPDESATDLRVRAATADDAAQLYAILDSPHILDGTMRIPHSTTESTWESLRPNTNQRLLVAVDRSDRVVGLLVLVTHLEAPSPGNLASTTVFASHSTSPLGRLARANLSPSPRRICRRPDDRIRQRRVRIGEERVKSCQVFANGLKSEAPAHDEPNESQDERLRRRTLR